MGIRVILAISSDFYLEGFRKILGSQRDIEVVAETLQYLEIIPLLKRVKHDVLLLDTAIPNLNIVSILGSIKDKSPDTKVLLFVNIANLISLGVQGCLTSRSSEEEFIQAVKAVGEGKTWI
jgi:DNA-binding NarL/FixJ family response regulator